MKLLSFRNLLPLCALIALSLISCNKDDEVKLDFEITIPDNWTGYVLANEGTVYHAYRNEQSPADTVFDWLEVWKDAGMSNYNLSTYYTATKNRITDTDFNSGYVSTIAEKDTTINTTDFKRIITNETWPYRTSTNDTIDLNWVLTYYVFLENNNGYVFSLACQDTSYYRMKPVFDGIMSTFHYKN